LRRKGFGGSEIRTGARRKDAKGDVLELGDTDAFQFSGRTEFTGAGDKALRGPGRGLNDLSQSSLSEGSDDDECVHKHCCVSG